MRYNLASLRRTPRAHSFRRTTFDMAIVTAAIWQTWAGKTVDGSELASLEMLAAQVDQEIKDRLKRTLEQATYTDIILDGPITDVLFLHRWAPITINTLTVHHNRGANGDPTLFTNDTLLTAYTDYYLVPNRDNPSISDGKLMKRRGTWGESWERSHGLLTAVKKPSRGAVKLSFQGGYAANAIPKPIVDAACLLISMKAHSRRYGFMMGSENWNGYGYNLPGVGLLVDGHIGNPDVIGILNPYVNHVDNF